MVMLILALVLLTQNTISQVRPCEVGVSLPWATKTIIPQGSTVSVNCTATASNQGSLYWAIELPGNSIDHLFAIDFYKEELHNHGFFENSEVILDSGKTTIQLFINSTARNNGSVLKCVNRSSSIQETTINVYEPALINITLIQSLDEEHLINVSWIPFSYPEFLDQRVNQTYVLTISTSSNKSSRSITLEHPYHLFTPEDAPPCEVYNFSVTATATYVGATYTGAGCSVPSPVLSTMLPSLPDIVPLDSSIRYNIIFKQLMQIAINITFTAARDCQAFPVLNYTLEIKSQSSEVFELSVLPHMHNFIVENLTENANYSFRVLASNSVGMVSTNRRQFITTDVQNVTVTLIETMDAVVVQCVFITGSNAKGCMVVLVGEFGNKTANLTRINPCTNVIVNETILSLNDTLVFAYDIEFDGSVGTLAVPGVIVTSDKGTLCPPLTTTATTVAASTSGEIDMPVVIAIGGSVSAAIIILVIMTIIGFVICRKIKRSKKGLMVVQPLNVYSNEPDTNCSELAHCTDEELEIQAAEILYDQPVKALGRCSGDGAEYEKTKHTKDLEDITAVEREMNTYAELTEENHHYHTLEPQTVPHGLEADPDAPALPPPYRPPSPEPLPAYQEIGSLQVAKYDQERDTTNGEIVNDQYQSSQNQPPSEGAEVSSETLL